MCPMKPKVILIVAFGICTLLSPRIILAETFEGVACKRSADVDVLVDAIKTIDERAYQSLIDDGKCREFEQEKKAFVCDRFSDGTVKFRFEGETDEWYTVKEFIK